MRVQGLRTHTPLEITCDFLIQLVFYKKKMWFIGVQVKHETRNGSIVWNGTSPVSYAIPQWCTLPPPPRKILDQPQLVASSRHSDKRSEQLSLRLERAKRQFNAEYTRCQMF